MRIRWKKPAEQYDEMMFPKHVLSHNSVSSMLNMPGGPLVCHSKRRNGCFDFEGGQNNESLSFKPGCLAKEYRTKLCEFLRLSQKIAGESPTGAVSIKKRINWRLLKNCDVVERSILFCRHLDHLQLSEFANYLTKSGINFHFSSKTTIVIDVSGIDASVLVRLMHYAEVPVPTSETQGAFSISIRNVEGYAGDRDLLDSRVCFGRVGALNSYPLQIKCKELGRFIVFSCGALCCWYLAQKRTLWFQSPACDLYQRGSVCRGISSISCSCYLL